MKPRVAIATGDPAGIGPEISLKAARDARVREPHGAYAWQLWNISWNASPGEHELACRASDEAGNVQPLEPPWDLSGFGNNGVQRILVTVDP